MRYFTFKSVVKILNMDSLELGVKSWLVRKIVLVAERLIQIDLVCIPKFDREHRKLNFSKFRFVPLLYCSVVAAVCHAADTTELAIGFHVQGILTHQFSRFQGKDSTEVYRFNLIVKGGEWSIEQSQANGQKFYASGVGKSIFALPAVSLSKSNANGLAAEVYPGGYPYDLPSTLAIPWFVYASASYLKANEFCVLGTPVFHAVHEPFGVYFWSRPSISLDPPFLPSRATFIPGNPLWKHVVQHSDGVVRNASYARFVDDLDRKRFYASIPTNFIACDYKVLNWKSYKGLSLPKTFLFEVFMPVDGKGTPESFGSWLGEAESFDTLPVEYEHEMLPKIPNNDRLFILDRRLQDQSIKVDGVNYSMTNEWPVELPLFAEMLLNNKREYLRKSSSEPPGAFKRGPGIVIIAISVSISVGLVIRSLKKGNQ
jgi:hypothetical protein